MVHRSVRPWIIIVLSVAGCVSERRDADGAPLVVDDATGEGGAAGEAGAGGEDADGDDGRGGHGGAAPRGEGDACDDGEVQACLIEVGEQNGKKTCFSGSRRCRDGRWGPCHYVPGQPDEES